jgi:hypothetical protein
MCQAFMGSPRTWGNCERAAARRFALGSQAIGAAPRSRALPGTIQSAQVAHAARASGAPASGPAKLPRGANERRRGVL